MSAGRSRPVDFYPSDFFSHSLTFNQWAYITASDVHALVAHSSSRDRKVYFALNHPIKWICVTGAIVAIIDINTKWTILTLDDSSGATIDLRVQRLPSDIQQQEDCPSNTTVSNLDVMASLGVFDIAIDQQRIDIGTVIKARGTISSFRGQRQLDLERISVIQSTQEEVQFWNKIGEFRRRVSEPWRLTKSEIQQIQRAIEETKRKEEEKRRRKQKRDAQRMELVAARKAKAEEYEKKQDRLLRMEAAELDGRPLI